jgi:hypothetical protein
MREIERKAILLSITPREIDVPCPKTQETKNDWQGDDEVDNAIDLGKSRQ